MTRPDENKTSNRAIIIVALGFLALALSYSVRAILGLAMPLWESDLNWSRGSVSNIAAIALLIMAIIAPVSGMMLDRKGLRFTLLFGLIAVVLCCIVVSVASNTWILLIGFGIIGGVGFGIVSTHIIAAAVAVVYPQRVGFASGIATSGSTAGQFLVVPLIAMLFSFISWRWGFVSLAIATAILIPFVWLVKEPGQNKPAAASQQTADWKEQFTILLSSPVFHLLFWSYLICGYTTSGVIETHLMPYASFCGFKPVPSATAYGLLSAVNLVGMILIGWLTDKMNRPLLLGLIYIVRGLAFWLLLNVGSSYETLIIFAIIFGIVDYSTVPVTTSLLASHLGLKILGFSMGLLTAGHQIGAAIGASLGGYFYDKNATYDLIWLSSITLAVFAGLLVFMLNDKPVHKPARVVI